VVEATVKTFVKEDNKIILRPHNIDFCDFVVDESVWFEICGVVNGIM